MSRAPRQDLLFIASRNELPVGAVGDRGRRPAPFGRQQFEITVDRIVPAGPGVPPHIRRVIGNELRPVHTMFVRPLAPPAGQSGKPACRRPGTLDLTAAFPAAVGVALPTLATRVACGGATWPGNGSLAPRQQFKSCDRDRRQIDMPDPALLLLDDPQSSPLQIDVVPIEIEEFSRAAACRKADHKQGPQIGLGGLDQPVHLLREQGADMPDFCPRHGRRLEGDQRKPMHPRCPVENSPEWGEDKPLLRRSRRAGPQHNLVGVSADLLVRLAARNACRASGRLPGAGGRSVLRLLRAALVMRLKQLRHAEVSGVR